MASPETSDAEWAAAQRAILQRLYKNPIEVVETFRSLYNAHQVLANDKELFDLANMLSWALEDKCSNVRDTSVDPWKTLLTRGLGELCMDIIVDPKFFLEPPPWIGIIFSILSSIMILCDTSSQIVVPISKTLLDRAPGVFQVIWDKRKGIKAGGLGTSRGSFERLAWLIFHTTILYETRNRIKEGGQSKIPQVAIFSWFHLDSASPYAERALLGPNVLLKPTSEANIEKWEQEVIDALGAEAIIKRFRKAFDNPQATAVSFDENGTTLGQLAYHHDIQSLLGPFKIMKHIITCMRRLQAKASQEQQYMLWIIAARFMVFLFEEYKDDMGSGSGLKVQGEDVMALMTRGVEVRTEALSMKRECTRPWYCAQLINTVTTRLCSEHADEELEQNIKIIAHKAWYPTMKTLRNVGHVVLISKTYNEILQAWTDFGNAVGLDEEAERARFQKETSHMCSWKECRYHAEKAPHSLKACTGCGEARYCDRSCQSRDWKEGSHKARCKRLKA